jgi:hypothetical protein
MQIFVPTVTFVMHKPRPRSLDTDYQHVLDVQIIVRFPISIMLVCNVCTSYCKQDKNTVDSVCGS